jgi:hypothetical protein
MPTIRIRIGASVEADFGALIFRPLVEQAKAARAAVRREIDGIGADLGKAGGRRRGGAGAAGAEGGGGYRENAPGGDGELQRRRRTNRDIESEEERHQREMNRKQREASRLAEREQEREQNRRLRVSERRVERISGSTVSGFGGVVRRGAGVASDLARGAGIDLGLGNALQQRFSLEKSAIDLSNASFMPGAAGVAGQRQDPRALMAEAQGAADAAALDVNTAMEGLQAFVGKTGDLATGRAILKDMAILARATGGELNDIVSAAGDVAANLGEVGAKFKTPEEKARAVASVMAAMAAQGKVGAVEMKDLASQMAKLAASAPQFAGPIEQSMATMGALAQMARAKGGAASATQATTSVQGFVATFGKAARRKELKAAGVQVEDKARMLLDPEEIIVNALKATKGSTAGMNKLFMDASAQRVTRGFKNVYNQAEAEKKGSGETAVRAEFSKLKKASMSDMERSDSFQASMKGGEAQTQVLKNQLQKQLGDAVEQVAPQLLALVPAASDAVKAIGGLAGWAANNPFQAVTAALGVSLTKSLGEELMRAATAKMVTSAGASLMPGAFSMGGLQGASAAGTAMRTAGAALAITAAAVTIASVGMLAIEKVMSEEKKGKDAVFGDEMTAVNAATKLRMVQRDFDRESEKGGPSAATTARLAEAKKEAEAAQAQVLKRVNAGEQVQKGEGTGFLAASTNSFLAYLNTDTRVGGGQTLAERGAAQEAAAQMKQLQSDQQALASALKGTLKVEVVNQPGPGAPAVNPAGRTP